MVKTVLHYASLPTAGPMVHPDRRSFRESRPEGETVGAMWDRALAADDELRSEIGAYEAAMAEEFHRRHYPLAVMNYANWSPEGEADIVSDFDESDYDEELLTVTVSQKLPLTYPFSRAFFWHLPLIEVIRGDRIEAYPAKQIDFTSYIENHARFYLKDVN
jgi:hypothetical protein